MPSGGDEDAAAAVNDGVDDDDFYDNVYFKPYCTKS